MLVGWIIDNSDNNVARGNDNPEIYSGVEGKIPDMEGNIHYLKIKVYQVMNPKLSNVFEIFPHKLKKKG